MARLRKAHRDTRAPGAHRAIPAPQTPPSLTSGESGSTCSNASAVPVFASSGTSSIVGALSRCWPNALTQISEERGPSAQLSSLSPGKETPCAPGVGPALSFSFYSFCCCPQLLWSRHLPPLCTKTNTHSSRKAHSSPSVLTAAQTGTQKSCETQPQLKTQSTRRMWGISNPRLRLLHGVFSL